ncbi:rhodanese-like domain-containing protein [Puteibacter caeruleilacunae]|nr:rhodanese-like domain-containing protein [Puteibacter caeruleilacunae]
MNIKSMEQAKAYVRNIQCDQAKELLRKCKGNNKFHIIDTRDREMYKSGHLKGAILMDVYKYDLSKGLKYLPKDEIYLVYCTAGIRSSEAISIMQHMGFKHIYHLEHGLESCNIQEGELV